MERGPRYQRACVFVGARERVFVAGDSAGGDAVCWLEGGEVGQDGEWKGGLGQGGGGSEGRSHR